MAATEIQDQKNVPTLSHRLNTPPQISGRLVDRMSIEKKQIPISQGKLPSIHIFL